MFRSPIYSQLRQVFLPLFALEVAGLLGDLLTSGTSPPRNPVYRLCGEFWTVNSVRFDLLITCLSVYCLPYCPFTSFCLCKKGDVTMLWCHRPFRLAQQNKIYPGCSCCCIMASNGGFYKLIKPLCYHCFVSFALRYTCLEIKTSKEF